MAWLITTDGFYSAVAHKTDPDLLTVRCRHLVDAEHLCSFLEAHYLSLGEDRSFEPVAYTAADYPWRVFVAKTAFAAFMAHQVMQIDYGNFKDEVTRKQGRARHDIYSSVWVKLLGIERLVGAKRGHDAAAARARRAGIVRPGYGTLPLSWDVRPRRGRGREEQCSACGRWLSYWNIDLCDRCEDGEPDPDDLAAVEAIAAEQLHEPGSPFYIGPHEAGDGCEVRR